MNGPIPEYDELRLRVEPAGRGSYHVVAFAPDGATATGEFESPLSETELENFILRVTRVRAVRAYKSTQMEDAKQLGGALFEHLLRGDVGDLYHGARKVADSQERGLRISLSMTGAPELLEIPWEFLYDPGDAYFLSQSIFTPVVRTLDLRNPRPSPTVTLPLKVLGLVSSPAGFPPLDTDAEREKLERALAPLVHDGAVQLEWLESATLSELDRRIAARDELHVIHYIGHGAYSTQTRSGIVLLEDAAGNAHEVTGEELGSYMRDERSLRLVVLNSCEGARASHVDPFSGVAASLLRCGLPAVVGMQTEITDEAAIVFSDRLYTSLAQGFPIDAALAQARRAIFAAGGDVEFGTPVLFMRVADGRIFHVSDEPPPPPVGRLELDLRPEPQAVRPGGTFSWQLEIRNAGGSAMSDVIARDQTGETRAGPLALDAGAATECSWTARAEENDLDECVTVGARGSDGRLVSAQASAGVEVRPGGWWPPSTRAMLAAGGTPLAVLAVVLALGLLGGGDSGAAPDARVFNAGTEVPDIDARGDNVAFLASVEPGESTEIRRLDLESWKAEPWVGKAPKRYGLDVGLSAARGPQLVYAGCAEPTACDLYTRPFNGPQKPLLASTPECSEVRPSLSEGLLLFASQGPGCPKELKLGPVNSPNPETILEADTGGADINHGVIVWLTKPGGALVAKNVDAAGGLTAAGTRRPSAGEQFLSPIVVEGKYVYFTHGQGAATYIARVALPLRADSEIEHYVPGGDVPEAELKPHFAVTGDTLFVTSYPLPNGEPGARKIVRVRHPNFDPAD